MPQKTFKNPIWVAGIIDNKDFFVTFTKRYSELMSKTKPEEVITVFINSPGGETNTALGIYDLLEKCNRNTVGIVSGIAHSGASLILQACRKRLMTPNSHLMLHKSTVQVKNSVENAQSALDTFRKLDERFYSIYASRAGRQVSKIAEMAHKDKYFDAQAALEANLIDEILV